MDQIIYHSSKNNLKILKEKLAINKSLLSSILPDTSRKPLKTPEVQPVTSSQDEANKNEEEKDAVPISLADEPKISKIPLTVTSVDLEDRDVIKKTKRFRKDNNLKLLLNEFDVLKEPELNQFYDDSDEFDFFDDDLLIKEERERVIPRN
jgi:hypothetical protein